MHPNRPAAVGLVLGGAVSAQFGGAVAALLFPRAGVAGVVTLRLAVAAAVLLLVCRPRMRGYRAADWALVGAFGLALAAMNTLFYHAIDRVPLGPAVMLEVLGPLALAALAARRAAGWLWAGLALAGAALLGRAGFDRLDPAGVAFALGAGAMWAAYIVLSARVGRRFPKVDGLALAMTAAALATLPLGVAGSGTALFDPPVLALGAAVALLSSALPYALELTALRRLPTATFAVLMSLGPAVAAAAGYLVLGQRLTPLGGLAIALVVLASIGAVRTPPAGTARVAAGVPSPGTGGREMRTGRRLRARRGAHRGADGRDPPRPGGSRSRRAVCGLRRANGAESETHVEVDGCRRVLTYDLDPDGRYRPLLSQGDAVLARLVDRR